VTDNEVYFLAASKKSLQVTVSGLKNRKRST